MALNTLSISLTIPASQEAVWKKIADWKSQGDWMLQTRVWVTSDQSEGVGTSIAAFTGPLHKYFPRFKFLGLLDEMNVTRWSPPHRCDVDHVGKVLKGTGTFQLSAVSTHSTRFDWSETIVAPRALFVIFAPFLYIGVRISLARFARSFT
ncbi:MAG: hypothetical protein RLZ23_156 [Actinomycetota bacterium]